MDEFDLDPPRTAAQERVRHALRRSRRAYEKLTHAPTVGTWTDGEIAGQAASDLIRATLETGEPALVARFGAGELAVVLNYLGTRSTRPRAIQTISFIRGRSGPWWWERGTVSDLAIMAGFFPATVEALDRFAELMLECMPAVDVLGSWLPSERIVSHRLRSAVKVPLGDLEPYEHRDPWSAVLEDRTVLVVHPFAATIASQYQRRELLFADRRVLPDFELKTLAAVQSIARTPTPFATWFDALAWMSEGISTIDFDVAIIGCGAYGFPLATHVKRLGKQAVHLGGATQMLFGIKGRRWDGDPTRSWLYNDSWVRPSEQEHPPGFALVEGGAYW